MKNWIPNSITLLNLFCGTTAIIALLDEQLLLGAALLLAAAVADFFDGLVARLLRVAGPMGKELDSLADMVSFGVAPGIILYAIYRQGLGVPALLIWSGLPLLIVALFSAIRLAKFNLDDRQTDSFIGLPTPAATLFVVGLLLIYEQDSFGLGRFIQQPAVLFASAITLSALLVAELPMFSLKFKHFRWQGNQIRYIFAAIALLFGLLLQEAAIAPLLLVYIIINLIRSMNPQM